MEEISIYTDGGCSGNPGPGGWGYVIIDTLAQVDGAPGESPLEIPGSGGERVTTNNRMELTAVIRALEKVIANPLWDERSLAVYTDSQYVQKGISQWITGWKRNGWKTASKEPVKNQDLWMALDVLAEKRKPRWQWVKGHAGNTYNEMVDAMTQDEIRAFSSRK
jgi:ribonuclease HI